MRHIKEEFLDNGVAGIRESLEFLVGKEKITREAMDTMLTSLLVTTTDMKEAVSDAQVIIEAVPEITDGSFKTLGT